MRARAARPRGPSPCPDGPATPLCRLAGLVGYSRVHGEHRASIRKTGRHRRLDDRTRAGASGVRAAQGAAARPAARGPPDAPAGRPPRGRGLYALFHAEIAPEGAEEPRIWAPGLARPQADGANAPAQRERAAPQP